MSETKNEQTSKPKRSPAPKTRPQPHKDETALADKLQVAINDLRASLRNGETLALPGLILRMLPDDANKGDQSKVMDWRAWVVWAEWTGTEWDVIVYQDGKKR